MVFFLRYKVWKLSMESNLSWKGNHMETYGLTSIEYEHFLPDVYENVSKKDWRLRWTHELLEKYGVHEYNFECRKVNNRTLSMYFRIKSGTHRMQKSYWGRHLPERKIATGALYNTWLYIYRCTNTIPTICNKTMTVV